MLKKLFSIILVIVASFAGYAQEFNCKVKVMSDRIQGVDNSVFTGLERALTEFLNTRKWTKDQYNINEKIECNVLLNVTTVVEEDMYDATLDIQATRPVYNAAYQTALINYQDADVQFKYVQYQQLNFNESRVQGTDAVKGKTATKNT